MKEFRIILLIALGLVAGRMLGEIASCPYNPLSLCSKGLVVFVPYLLATYFVDSAVNYYINEKEEKKVLLNTILAIPYIIFTIYVILEFLTSASIVTVEYIFNPSLVVIILLYAAIYLLNNLSAIRKLNTAFMVTFLLSVLVFQFI